MQTNSDVLPDIDDKDVPPMPKVKCCPPVRAVELVSVAMNRSDRIRQFGQITARMQQLGLPGDYESLDLGFELPPDWPMDNGSEVTLAKLIALAAKLKMRIEITDLNLIPLK